MDWMIPGVGFAFFHFVISVYQSFFGFLDFWILTMLSREENA